MRAAALLIVSLLLEGCVLWGGAAREASPAGPEPERSRSVVREVPPNPELEHSRGLISQAEKDPRAKSQFKADLDQARAALDQALAIWIEERGKLDEDDEEWQEIRHLNYVARQRTAIVVMKTRGLAAQHELAQLQSRHPPGLESRKQARAHSPVVPPDVARDVPPSLQSMRPRQDPRGLVLTLDSRYFGDDQRLVNGDALIDALLAYLVANPAKIVSCEGHSDARDGAALSQRLSQQRARAVQEALLERGLELSRVTAIGYGNSRSSAETWGPAGSRRVEIVISEPAPVDYSADTTQ